MKNVSVITLLILEPKAEERLQCKYENENPVTQFGPIQILLPPEQCCVFDRTQQRHKKKNLTFFPDNNKTQTITCHVQRNQKCFVL